MAGLPPGIRTGGAVNKGVDREQVFMPVPR